MGYYDRQIATATRLIAEKGETSTWTQITPGGTAAKPSAGTPATHSVKIVYLPVELEYLGTLLSMIKDTEIPSGFLTGFMAQVPFAPTLKDTVTRASGEVLGIVDKNGIEAIDPNGEGVILYIVRFTR